MMTKFLGLLSLISVVAKLANWIDWSWWLVFSPAIAAFVIAISVLAFAGVLLFKAQAV